jgi:hypothetical protein
MNIPDATESAKPNCELYRKVNNCALCSARPRSQEQKLLDADPVYWYVQKRLTPIRNYRQGAKNAKTEMAPGGEGTELLNTP